MTRETGFHILTLVPSEQRARNLQQAATRFGLPETAKAFLFTTIDQFRTGCIIRPDLAAWWGYRRAGAGIACVGI